MPNPVYADTTFRVIDALDAPHGGRILRLRLEGGEAPTVRRLRGARLRATSPDGELSRTAEVEDFVVLGGVPSDARLKETGRADLRVFYTDAADGPEINLRWTVEIEE